MPIKPLSLGAAQWRLGLGLGEGRDCVGASLPIGSEWYESQQADGIEVGVGAFGRARARATANVSLVATVRNAGDPSPELILPVGLGNLAARVLADPHPTVETAAQIARLVGYLPLALALVAARIKASPHWTLADHLERLVDQRKTLRLDDGVELAVALSYRDLGPAERRAFRLLALYPGGDIERYAAAALIGADLPTAQRLLDRLRTVNLLQQKAFGRYRYHDVLRLFAASRASDEEAASARRAALTRLLDHYEHTASLAIDQYAPHEKHLRPEIAPADTPGPGFTDRDSVISWLEAEHHNLIATAQYAADNGWETHASRQSDMLARFLEASTHYNEAAILHTLAMNTPDPCGRVRAANSLAYTYVRMGRHDEALSLLEDALPRARQLGDRQTERRVLNHLGIVLVLLGRSTDALPYHQESLRLVRELNDRLGEGIGLHNLGILFENLGRYEEALASLATASMSRSPWTISGRSAPLKASIGRRMSIIDGRWSSPAKSATVNWKARR